MRRRWRWILRCAAAALALVLLYFAALAFPQPFFSQRADHGNFRVYTRTPVDPHLETVLDEVTSRLSASEIYDPSIVFRVFVAETPLWYTFFNGPYRGAMARNYEIGNPIYLPALSSDVERVVHFDGREESTASILAHEATHTLVQHAIGLLAVWRLPWWKKEGYAEYVGSGRLRAHRENSGKSGVDSSPVPGAYDRARRFWQHLIEVRGMTFREIIDAQIDEATLEAEVADHER
ncbi:MAG: hypothetical protein HYR85_01265 [Planctomycetes bacterium]|nr:hypothetical protein [Planctomycetota bacterium]MBI3843154.1 hypothetical protein [Planctomycetota bacterium]